MNSATVVLLVLGIANAILLVLLLRRKPVSATPEIDARLESARQQIERSLRDELTQNRRESSDEAGQLRREVNVTLGGANAAVLERVEKLREGHEAKLAEFRVTVEDRVNSIAADARRDAQELRKDAVQTITAMSQDVAKRLGDLKLSVENLSQQNELRLEAVRSTVEMKLGTIQQDNAAKLEQMRQTVDEKLQSTLEQRLGESFRLVSERLEAVAKGLGEMQTLASGVGDLKRVLTNVKTRGTWGEVQLGNLLDQMLTPEQYSANVAVKPGSAERVEFAIKLPGREEGAPVWLPIDAKFPQEDYQRLLEAGERGDAEAVAAAGQALETRIVAEAKKIREKYIEPPHTTDFAILFLPTEGLYAEVLRRAGMDDKIRREHVMLAGPTNLAAILNSLQMGFRTLAIEKRSSEVWSVLGAVKTEFGKFGAVLAKVQDKLHQASQTIEDAQKRSRVMARRLSEVEGLPGEEAQKMLPGIAVSVEEDEETKASAAQA